MFLIFATILTLVIVIPLLWPQRMKDRPELRLRLYASLGIAAVGALITGLAIALLNGSPFFQGFLSLVGFTIGLAACGVLAVSIIESGRQDAASPSDGGVASGDAETPLESTPTPNEDTQTP